MSEHKSLLTNHTTLGCSWCVSCAKSRLSTQVVGSPDICDKERFKKQTNKQQQTKNKTKTPDTLTREGSKSRGLLRKEDSARGNEIQILIMVRPKQKPPQRDLPVFALLAFSARGKLH